MTQKRSWFFDSPPSDSGIKFRTQNIPAEETYAELFRSVPFFDEGDSMGTTGRQGLVLIYGDSEAIDNRDNAAVNAGKQYVLKPYQAPGTGVNFNGTYTESNPVDGFTDGTSVSGTGIKSTGKVYTLGAVKRIGYQVELDPSSLNSILSVTPGDPYHIMIYDTAQKETYVAPYSMAVSSFTFVQQLPHTTWTVTHNLNRIPMVQVIINNQVAYEQVTHNNVNQFTVVLSSAQTGSVVYI